MISRRHIALLTQAGAAQQALDEAADALLLHLHRQHRGVQFPLRIETLVQTLAAHWHVAGARCGRARTVGRAACTSNMQEIKHEK